MTQAATMVAMNNNLFLDVDVKEALGQAVAIATCQTLEGKKAIAVCQVENRLDFAIEMAMRKAVSQFVTDEALDLQETEDPSKETGGETTTESESTEAVAAVPETAETATSDDAAFIGVPDDIADIPDDIPDEVISEETRYNVSISDEGAEGAEVVETAETTEPVVVTEEDVEKEISDFRVVIGDHQKNPIMASEAVAKILVGDEKEMRFLESIQSFLLFAKERNVNQTVREHAEKFIQYAAEYGVKL